MNFNDDHLKVFFMSLFIYVLCFCGIYCLLSEIYPEIYKSDEGYIRSFISLATCEEGEEKMLVDSAYLFGNSNSREEQNIVEVTDKIIDFGNRGIWLTDGQRSLGVVLLMSAMIAVLVYLLTGLGTVFEWLRPHFGMGVVLLFTFPPFGVAVTAAVLMAVCLIGILLPVYLTVILVRGIIDHFNVD